jgi:hypothetical protein
VDDFQFAMFMLFLTSFKSSRCAKEIETVFIRPTRPPQRQCSDVLEECAALLIAVHRETGDIQDVSSLAERLDKTVSQWTVLTPLECLLRRNDMKQEILRLHELIREFNAVNLKHNVAGILSCFLN